MLPHRSHDKSMDLPQLCEIDELPVAPLTACDGLCVHPLGRVGVGLDLQVFPQLFVANRAPLLEEGTHLAQYHRIALDGRGVVGLLVPNPGPDGLGFLRTGQTTHIAQCCLGSIEVLQYRLPGWSSTRQLGTSSSV